MKRILLALTLPLIICVAISTPAQSPQELFRSWQQQHLSHIDPPRVRHADLKKYLEQLRGEGIAVKEVGRSTVNREIFQMEFGRGPLKVFMWSQMHGDEPTATSALVDLFHFLQKNRRLAWVAAIEQQITLRAVPMLNPDGAELYQRRNLQFIDINRDARSLATPEGRLLKKLRDEWSPDIGFNLHNQQPRTTVGDTGLQATISLLAVPFNAYGNDNAGRIRNKKLCAVMIESLAPFIYGHIARYDDEFNPRAFGDLISQWGTPVILIETGALRGKTEMELVQLNFVAFASALNALADGSVNGANPAVYDALRYNNTSGMFSLIVRNATVVNRVQTEQPPRRVPPFVADVAINESSFLEDGQTEMHALVQDIGDMSFSPALSEVDASGYYVTVARGVLRPGAEASLLFYKKNRAAQIDWTTPDLETRFPPDAVYRNGEWIKRGNLVVK